MNQLNEIIPAPQGESATQALKHTPTPWYLFQSNHSGPGNPFWDITVDDSRYSRSIATLCTRANSGEDAEYIVKAVNSHATLVALVTEAKQLLEHALTHTLSIHETAHFLLKIENWEATK